MHLLYFTAECLEGVRRPVLISSYYLRKCFDKGNPESCLPDNWYWMSAFIVCPLPTQQPFRVGSDAPELIHPGLCNELVESTQGQAVWLQRTSFQPPQPAAPWADQRAALWRLLGEFTMAGLGCLSCRFWTIIQKHTKQIYLSGLD